MILTKAYHFVFTNNALATIYTMSLNASFVKNITPRINDLKIHYLATYKLCNTLAEYVTVLGNNMMDGISINIYVPLNPEYFRCNIFLLRVCISICGMLDI